MGKPRTTLACEECGHRMAQWAGRCPGCGAWGTIGERSTERRPSAQAIAPLLFPGWEEERIGTGFAGVDRVLGGGLVQGSVVLIAGEPGIGKSTLLLQLAEGLTRHGRPCLFASGEESGRQVAARAARLAIAPGSVSFVPGRELPVVVDAVRSAGPSVLIVDSMQAIRDPDSPSLPGGSAQVRACADALVGLAKEVGVAVLLAGQVTKDGDVAGPRTLEHAVDVVCAFDGDPRTGLRVLTGGKNRFGAEGEAAWFEMGPRGLQEIDPAAVLCTGDGDAGSATALFTAGRRAVALEIQSLVGSSDGPPRRNVSGLDARRFEQVAAVVERSLGLGLSRRELYGAAAGGLRVDDPGTDLAVAAALASAATGIPPPAGSAFVGEVSLTGAVRPVAAMGSRLAAAAAAGITTVYGPGPPSSGSGVRAASVRRLDEALRWSRRRAAHGGRGERARTREAARLPA